MRSLISRKWTICVIGGVLLAAYPIGRCLYGYYYCAAVEKALDRRDFTGALSYLGKCRKVWADDSRVRVLAAQCARRQGDYKTAQEMLDGVTTPGADAERQLLRTEQGDWNEIELILSATLDCQGASPAPLALEAAIKGGLELLGAEFDRGNVSAPLLDRVLQAIECWLRTRPGQADQIEGLVWRGRCRSLGDDIKQARHDLHKALELDSAHLAARFELALTIVQDSPREADAHLTALLNHHPDHKSARLLLALVRRKLGAPEQAIQLLDYVLAREPSHLGALMERGNAALDLNQADQAEFYFRRAYAVAPLSPAVNLGLASCLRSSGKLEEAKIFQQYFEKLNRSP